MKALTLAATTASFATETQKFASKKITAKFSGYKKHGREIDVMVKPYLTTANARGIIQLRVYQIELIDAVKYLLSKHFSVKLSDIKAVCSRGHNDDYIIANNINAQSIKFIIKRVASGYMIVEDTLELSITELTNYVCRVTVSPTFRKLIGFIEEDGKMVKTDKVMSIDLPVEQKEPFVIKILRF